MVERRLLVATTVFWVAGVADDWTGLNPQVRLTAAASAGLLRGVLQDPFPGRIGVSAFVVVVAVLVNAVNLFDGLDALAGSVGVVAAAGPRCVEGVMRVRWLRSSLRLRF